jgi:hypothetical protein
MWDLDSGRMVNPKPKNLFMNIIIHCVPKAPNPIVQANVLTICRRKTLQQYSPPNSWASLPDAFLYCCQRYLWQKGQQINKYTIGRISEYSMPFNSNSCCKGWSFCYAAINYVFSKHSIFFLLTYFFSMFYLMLIKHKKEYEKKILHRCHAVHSNACSGTGL